jgi:hypothetical protein
MLFHETQSWIPLPGLPLWGTLSPRFTPGLGKPLLHGKEVSQPLKSTRAQLVFAGRSREKPTNRGSRF